MIPGRRQKQSFQMFFQKNFNPNYFTNTMPNLLAITGASPLK